MFLRALPLLLITAVSLTGAAAANDDLPLSHPDAERHAHVRHLHDQAEEAIILRDFRRALVLYQDALLAHPDDAWAYLQMGRVYMILGQDRRAEIAFANALHIEPDNSTAIAALRRIKDPDGQGWGIDIEPQEASGEERDTGETSGEAPPDGGGSPYPRTDPYPLSPPTPADPSDAQGSASDRT